MSEEHGEGGGGTSGGYIAQLLAKVGYEVDTHGLDKLHHSLEKIKHIAEIAVGFKILEGIHTLGERFASTGEALESAAVQTGLTTDNLQRLQYAASQNAISAESMTQGLTRLNRQLFQAQKGSKSAQATFASLGITPDQLASFNNVEEAFYAVQDGINALGSQQQKVATIMQLFGRGGAQYLKLISAGSDATRQLGERAEKVGAIISDKNIEALASFEDSMSSLRLTLRSFLANIAGAFIPGITRGIRALEEFFGRNKQLIADGIAYAADRFGFLTYVAYRVFRGLGTLVERSLYGGDGIGGKIHDFLSGIGDDLHGLVENGSLQQILQSLTEFFRAGKEAGTDFIDSMVKLFGLFDNKVDTTGLSEANKAAILLLTTLQTILDVGSKAFKAFSYFAKGQFGSDLYELFEGAATDISVSMEQRRQGNNAALSQTVGLAASGLAAAGSLSGPGGAAAALAVPQGQAARGAPTVIMNSKVEVTAAPGMSEQQLADKMAASQQKSIREMAQDFATSWMY